MKITINGSGETLDVSEQTFDRPYNEALVHQVVVAFEAGARSGTKAQKSRADVRGTTKKFKKQKGGGARHGDYRAPIFVGGGVTFAARPRSFEQKVNRKMYRGAMQTILSELLRKGRLKIVDRIEVSEPKTRSLVAELTRLEAPRALIVSEDIGPNLYLASRNLPHVGVTDVAGIDPVSLIAAGQVVMTVDAVKKVEEWLG